MDLTNTTSYMPQLAQRFQTLIWTCIDNELYRSAHFYSERYLSLDPENHEARHLYATALVHERQFHSALYLVSRPVDAQCGGCAEIRSKCQSALGRHRQAYQSLETCLTDITNMSQQNAPRTVRTTPDEAVLHCKAGTRAMKGNMPDKAAAKFRQALNANCLLWEAFEGLSSLGLIADVSQLLPPRPIPIKRTLVEDIPAKLSKPAPSGFFTPDATGQSNSLWSWVKDAAKPPAAFRLGGNIGHRDSIGSNDSSFYPADTTFQHAPRTTRAQSNIAASTNPAISRPLSSAEETGPVQKKLRSTGRLPESIRGSKGQKPPDEPIKKLSSLRGNAAPSKPSVAPISTLGTRRSTRLLGNNTGTKTQQNPKPTSKRRQATRGRSQSIDESEIDDEVQNNIGYLQSQHSDRSPSPSQELALQEAFAFEQADYYIYELMRRFAFASNALVRHSCKQCLIELDKLPDCHQKSAWVLAMVGKAHFESLDYAEAERAFKALREIEPTRLKDMELYSTLLWHLQRPVDLSFLSQELVDIDPQAPEGWIAVGNLFSLHRDRIQALTCFRRAVQLDDTCAYAYSLSGHESIDDNLDKAINFFQSALRVDARYYNAWYGLGTCYMRMSKLQLAEYHFRKALDIYPSNAVLMGCVGLTYERTNRKEMAARLYNEALVQAPQNAMVRFRRAKIYISDRKYQAAIDDLEFLRKTAPEEANVIFQLAKAYRLIGDEDQAAKMLAVARDAAPRSANKMQKLLELVKDNGDDKMDEG